MRLKNSKYNVAFNIIQLFLTTILSFLARSFFINILGKEYLGLDGLFTNILSMLSLTELGLTTAINYSLYKPVANEDYAKISQLMTLYKKLYKIIGIVIFAIGIIIMPFLHLFINGYEFNNIYIIYILYLITTVSSYFFIYRETLINAYQKNYKLFGIKSISTILLYSLQILFIIKTHDFIAYLIITFIVKFTQNFLISWYVGKKYPKVNYNSNNKIDKKTKNEIIGNVKALFVTRIGEYLLNGTDNIIISTINIGLTGIYANYLSIIGIMNTFINTLYNGIVASFGNLVVLESNNTQENVFDISNFICFIISGFIMLELIFTFNPFITLWVGSNFLLEFWMVIIISVNFYFCSQMISLDVIKRASGKYKVDAHISIIQAVVNLIVSIVLGKIIGIGGVFIGTLVSYVFVALIFKPYLIYKNIFKKLPYKYYLYQLKYFLTLVFVCMLCYYIKTFITIPNPILNIIICGLIFAIIYFIIIIIIYRHDNCFKYVYDNFIKIHFRGAKK